MLETLSQLDHALSLIINHAHFDWLDAVMIAISGKLTWIPLYGLLAYLFYRVFGWKGMVIIIGGIALNLVLTDQISVAFKNGFERLRPCHHPELSTMLHLAAGCGGKFGFVSSHAANTMGLAVLTSLLLKKNWVTGVMMSFAFLNSYSRVYLGKHYLGDVAGGMILGCVIGYAVYYLVNFIIQKWAAK